MKARFSPPRRSGNHGSRTAPACCGARAKVAVLPGPSCATWLEFSMKWETPVAIDFRFGMEITMYIANR